MPLRLSSLVLREQDAVHLLAFVGGFVDASGYLRLQSVFTSSITGNLVVACSSVSSSHGVRCRSLVCVSFFGAGVLSSAFSLRARLAHGLSAQWRGGAVVVQSSPA